MNLEEEFQELPIADPRGIEDDLHGLRMPAMIAIGRIGCGAAGIADARGKHAVVAAKQILHAPETTACKNSAFFTHELVLHLNSEEQYNQRRSGASIAR